MGTCSHLPYGYSEIEYTVSMYENEKFTVTKTDNHLPIDPYGPSLIDCTETLNRRSQFAVYSLQEKALLFFHEIKIFSF